MMSPRWSVTVRRPRARCGLSLAMASSSWTIDRRFLALVGDQRRGRARVQRLDRGEPAEPQNFAADDDREREQRQPRPARHRNNQARHCARKDFRSAGWRSSPSPAGSGPTAPTRTPCPTGSRRVPAAASRPVPGRLSGPLSGRTCMASRAEKSSASLTTTLGSSRRKAAGLRRAELGRSFQSVPDQELQRAVKTNMGQRRLVASLHGQRRRAKAQEAEVGIFGRRGAQAAENARACRAAPRHLQAGRRGRSRPRSRHRMSRRRRSRPRSACR